MKFIKNLFLSVLIVAFGANSGFAATTPANKFNIPDVTWSGTFNTAQIPFASPGAIGGTTAGVGTFTTLTQTSDTINGTAGAGFLKETTQSSTPATPSAGSVTYFTDTNGAPSTINSSGQVSLVGWIFLGKQTWTSGATTPAVTWSGSYNQILIQYFIAGYNGGTPVGRFLCGSGTPSTTALTNGSSLSEGVTAPSSAPSIPGCPLAVTLSAISREGWIFFDGLSGQIKHYEIIGQEGGSVSTPPTMFRAVGVFSDLSTNLPIQQIQLGVYDTLTATALSAQTFTANTYVAAWGRNSD